MNLIKSPIALADLDRVLELAKRLPVFPCRQDKRPLVTGGFHAASQDEATIRKWWHDWPDALVAVPTGQITRLVVIDWDPDKSKQASQEWLASKSELLLSTRSHKTPRGGLHYLFRTADRYMTGTDIVLSGSPRSGIDLRAAGGYVIWWPMHLPQTDDTSVAQLPAGLIDERRFDTERDMAPLPTATPAEWQKERPRAASALELLTPGGYEQWIRVGMAMHAASGGSDEGFGLWHEWSAQASNYDGIEDCRYHWISFGRNKGRGVSIATLYQMAKAEGFSTTPMSPQSPGNQAATDAPAGQEGMTEQTTRKPLDWDILSQSEPPQRNWAVPHWLGLGYITLLAGPGGVGKTLLAQQLASGLALGDSFLGKPARPLRVLMWAGEDDHDELWRRQWQIATGAGQLLKDYKNLTIESFSGRDCTLVEPVFSKLVPTAMMDELAAQVADYKADVVILDNIARLYGGDENSRHQVTQFINWVSGACNKEHQTAVLLLAHPAKAQNSEYAGSTAWEAAVRSRWFFGRTLPDDENPPTDDNVRYLSRRKSNYSSLDCVKMDFDPALHILRVAQNDEIDNRRSILPARAEKMIIDSLNELAKQNVYTSDGSRQQNFLIREMVRRDMAPAKQHRVLEEALFRLMKAGKVRREVVGRYANRVAREGLVVASEENL